MQYRYTSCNTAVPFIGVILSGANHSSIVICEVEGSAVVLAVALSASNIGATSLEAR
jgi:hypothetical protein